MADLLDQVAGYYSAQLAEHGQSAQGVDWNGEASQHRRFEQLARIIDGSDGFTVNDLGCGYGAFFDFLRGRYNRFSYLGYDISARMVDAAGLRHPDEGSARFTVAAEPTESADYGIASGIFNVRLSTPEAQWRAYVEETLDSLDRTSRRGFAFNCLTTYSDPEKLRDYLHYADPAVLFDRCKRRYSTQVALLHDYGLYEFTILVRKEP